MEKIFGWEGVEARLLLHWRLGAFSGPTISFSRRLPKSELPVEGGWTLAIVEHLVNRGLIDRAVVEEAYAKLVGFNYQITHFRGSVIVAALRVSNGSVAAFPMRRMIQAFGPLAAAGAHRNTAFLMLAEFVLKLSLEPLLPETKCRAIKALLDTFPTDTATEAQLAEARVSGERPNSPGWGYFQQTETLQQQMQPPVC